MESWTLSVADGAAALDPAAWDACAGTDHVFLRHGFLTALEQSGSVGGMSGWTPRPLLLHDAEERLIGAAPAYVKDHSYGEYVFDHAWADAAQRAGMDYYPKLLVAAPFTPAPGPRLLTAPDAPPEAFDRLADGLVAMVAKGEMSSAHVTFCPPAEAECLAARGWLVRYGVQYHWENAGGWRSFDDFLGALSSRKRKMLRKERQAARDSGLTIRPLVGAEITEAHWAAFYGFYLATAEKKWGHPYLRRSFFQRMGAALGDKVVLVVAERDGVPIAGALNLICGDTLVGRNWGAVEDLPFLHFECCYYQAIDFALAQGLKRVEAGAQGEHKILRGYLPNLTYSAHWIADPELRDAIDRHLQKERPAMLQRLEHLTAELSPYRQEGGA